jgi:hypothetical protein
MSNLSDDRGGQPDLQSQVLTPAEFAARFGKERTWAYRMIWRGRVAILDLPGRYSIPETEVYRILRDVRRLLDNDEDETK